MMKAIKKFASKRKKDKALKTLLKENKAALASSDPLENIVGEMLVDRSASNGKPYKWYDSRSILVDPRVVLPFQIVDDSKPSKNNLDVSKLQLEHLMSMTAKCIMHEMHERTADILQKAINEVENISINCVRGSLGTKLPIRPFCPKSSTTLINEAVMLAQEKYVASQKAELTARRKQIETETASLAAAQDRLNKLNK